MEYRAFGRTGIRISRIAYGGIVSAGKYEGMEFPELGQAASDRYVSWAVDRGINYFDVAPSYGNAQEQMGNSLKPYRNRVHLACKTLERDRAGAERELQQSLKELHTDHLDVYQLHCIASKGDVEAAFAPGGVMELMRELKEKGVVANVGFSAHNEEAAIEMLQLYDFDSVLFPFNWFMHMEYGMGARLLRLARERNMGVLAMKAFVERSWNDDAERYASCFPKSWCKPVDVEDGAFGLAAMKYALSLDVDALVPPGNFPSFSFAVEHIDQCLNQPLSAQEQALLQEKRLLVRGKAFFEING